MALILTIDTALEQAFVVLSSEGRIEMSRTNLQQKEHASWVHTAINEILIQSGLGLQNFDAIAVVGGPGSYTGLRVGMATAKGLCYTTSLPLLNLNSLKLLARSAARFVQASRLVADKDALIIPLIDARRMEVFTAVYNSQIKEVMAPSAIVLNEHSFKELLQDKKIIFLGSGAEKFEKICNHPNAFFIEQTYMAEDIVMAAEEQFLAGQFVDLAYIEPVYLKEFYTNQPTEQQSS